MYFMNIKFKFVVLLIFLIISFLFIGHFRGNGRSQFHSKELVKSTTTNGDSERIDYLDSNGNLTIAADLGYATIVITKTENSKLERYFDDKGEPINRYNGYYAALYEYDSIGNKVCITYLDNNDKPVITANGYAIEENEYNENRQKIIVRYYDTEKKPIQTPMYGYGKINEYNENGEISKTTYINMSGTPMKTGRGFASVVLNYYTEENNGHGKVESEFYYDENGDPVCLSLGQYGLHKEYDIYGREQVLTYLDSKGQPIKTSKGYATVIKKYNANGNTATELYYDLDGNPYALSEGQYGIKVINGHTIYLGKNGEELFNLKRLLFNHPWIAVIAAMIMIVLSGLTDKKWNILFLMLYLCAICYLTLLFREKDNITSPGLFWYYKKIFTDSEARADIIKNIWLFIPLGSVLFRLYPKKTVLIIPVMVSSIIEIIQLISGTGFCELDDIISNSIGGWIGFCIGKLIADIKLEVNTHKNFGKERLAL